MISLWLIAALVLSSETRVIIEDDSTELPAIHEMVDVKIVEIENMIDGEDDNDESVTENIPFSDETTAEVVENKSETSSLSTTSTTTTTTTESLNSLEIFQEVHRLDDIPKDFAPYVNNNDEDLLEQLELNEVAINLDDDDIVDVINNFIADEDPMLKLFLSLCFLHPSCYQDSAPGALHTSDDSPLDISTMSPIASDLADNLINRRTERARNILVHALMQVQTHVRRLMFKYIEVGVAARGYSVPATMGIIDAVKGLWISVDSDLEFAKSSIQELFYLEPITSNSKIRALAEVADIIVDLPMKVEKLFDEATQDGYKDYVRNSSWNSWKRNPRDFE